MKKRSALLALLSLSLAEASLFADATPPPAEEAPAKENRPLSLYDQAKKRALKEAEALTQTDKYLKTAPGGKAAPSRTKAAAKPKAGGDLIRELAEEVDRLQSKMSVTNSTLLATQKPKAARRVGSKVTYGFKEGDVYEVHAGVDRVTDIQLQAGEELTSPPVAGDTVRWKIGTVKSSAGSKEVTHLVLKPLDSDIETNILVATTRRVYHLRAVSGDWYMPAVSWNYPQEEDPSYAAMVRRRNSEENLLISPDKLRFDYTIEGDSFSWKPVRVFDDGQKTYLQMPESLRASEAPALFIVEDGNAMLVNFRVKGSYYIADRLFEEAELRVGPKKRIEIRHKLPRKSFFERLFGD
jgi:type IV secretion system protein TrbG